MIYDCPYERRKETGAYVPYNCGEHYVIGAVEGGETEAFLKMCKTIQSRINDDLKKGNITKWHDESYLNHYIIGRNDVKYLHPGYCYPMGFDLPVEKIIDTVPKLKYFDVDSFKNAEKKKVTLRNITSSSRVRMYLRKLYYLIDCLTMKTVKPDKYSS